MLDERLAWAATEFGDVALATELLTSALDRIGSAPPSRAQVVVLTCYARNIYIRGLDGAVPAAERAIAAARTVDVPFAEADALITLAGALRDVGRPGSRRSVISTRRSRSPSGSTTSGSSAAPTTTWPAPPARRGDVERAIEVARAGFERARRSGAGGSFGPKYVLDHAWMLVTVGRWSEARHYIDEAALLGPEGIMRLLYCATAGWLETLSGDFDAAHRLLDEGRALGAELRDPRWAAWLLVVGAQLELLEGRPLGARREVAEGLLGGPRYQELTFAGRIGLEAEADLAELGRARHRDAEVAEARTRADELLARSRAARRDVPGSGLADRPLARGRPDHGRGGADPARGTVRTRPPGPRSPRAGRRSASRTKRPTPATETAEALLAAGHRRPEAEAELRAAHASRRRSARDRSRHGSRRWRAAGGSSWWRARRHRHRVGAASSSARARVVARVVGGRLGRPLRAHRPASARSWHCSRRAGRTARSATRCSSARARPASTSRTSSASSA